MARSAPGNPYHYGTPVSDEHFVGRQEELSALRSRMGNRVNVVLLSPRRYGKTSLIRAAEARLSKQRPKPAVIDVNVLRAASLAAFVGLVTAGAFRVPGGRWHRARQAVPEYVRHLRLSPVVTFDPAGTPRFSFDASLGERDAAQVLADVYGLLAEEAKARPAILVLDEFQAITRLAASLPDLLKALADEHPAVSLVLAGSKRHLMEDLVVKRRAPLFGMAERIVLGPIPDDEMAPYLIERSAQGGKPMTEEAARHLLALARPVPNDIQHLAFEAYEVGVGRIGADDVDEGMTRAVEHDSALFADAFSRLSPGQARVLMALAQEAPPEPYSAGFARSVGLASGSSVRKALQPLLANEEVVERESGLAVSDPFYAAWLRSSVT